MESGREQNYWPGFVDALSNVVLTLVFVLVVFVFALALVSSKVQKRVQEIEESKKSTQAQAQMQDETPQQVAALKEQLNKALTELQQYHAQNDNSASNNVESGAVDATAVASQNKDMEIAVEDKPIKENHQGQGLVKIEGSANAVTLAYPVSAAEIDDKSSAELGHVLDAIEKKTGKHKIKLRSIIGREPFTAARRLAYYRAIGVRNYLMTKGYGDGSAISSVIVQPTEPQDAHVEIVFDHE
jgi:hypothetical protein